MIGIAKILNAKVQSTAKNRKKETLRGCSEKRSSRCVMLNDGLEILRVSLRSFAPLR